tara:strand:+ start:469 stop:570 length:102 start_codon:yes stop_codon:yes gene_type:complete
VPRVQADEVTNAKNYSDEEKAAKAGVAEQHRGG